MVTRNANFTKAKRAKNDEFFTRRTDVEKEVMHYKDHFKGKRVYCNCDDPRRSEFFRYFFLNYERLGLVGLEASGLDRITKHGVICQYEGGVGAGEMESWISSNAIDVEDGRFQSEASLDALDRCDIVATNPPFSSFMKYIDLLVESGKSFLIIGNLMAAKNKNLFPFIKENRVWLGCNAISNFHSPTGDQEVPCRWYTNIEHGKRLEKIILYRKFAEGDYPRYDNYDAINIDKVKDIPCDYYGVMGVPISFLDRHNPAQFELLGITNSWDSEWCRTRFEPKYRSHAIIGDRNVAIRILIRRKEV